MTDKETSNKTIDSGELKEKPEYLPAKSTATTPAPTKQQAATIALQDVSTGDVNAFVAIAMMMESMRIELETKKNKDQPPRWIRIARAREFKEEFIGKGVIQITGAFLQFIGVMAELTLKAQDLLAQLDSGRALMEVGAKMLMTATNNDFLSIVHASVGIKDTSEIEGAKVIQKALKNGLEVMEYIPDPEDVDAISKELYQLLAVDQYDLPAEDKKAYLTGRARLLSWALEKPIQCHSLTNGISVVQLGNRRLKKKEKSFKDGKVTLTWKQKDKDPVTLYDFNYKSDSAKDIDEADKILKLLKYQNGGFSSRLKQFQKKNHLDESGILDLSTINQLMNLDYQKKTLRRAVPYSS